MVPAGYDAATKRVGLIERGGRALLAVRGRDRIAWLHNLVTNEVKNLRPGEGNYAFATNVGGRILFDLNVLVRDEEVWLDVGRDSLDRARQHLERYIITEDVTIADRTGDPVRLGILGPAAGALAKRIGLAALPAMAQLQSIGMGVAGADVTVIRHDFAGVLGAEVVVTERDAAESVRAALESAGEALGIAEVSDEALDVLRIEAGIPWMGRDIDEDILPAETGQIDRAVSYHKGCYLGQEVVERMRSRGALKRQLVGLKFDGSMPPAPGAVIEMDGAATGKVTSVCLSPAVEAPIGLAYVSSAHVAPGTPVTVHGPGAPATGTVAPLPFRADR